MYVRQREQGPIIQRIGDVFLTAAAEFRLAYPAYVGHLPVAEKRLKDEIESNGEFKRFLEVTLYSSISQHNAHPLQSIVRDKQKRESSTSNTF